MQYKLIKKNFGAIINSGLDNIQNDDIRLLKKMLLDYKVLFFKKQKISDDLHKTIASYIGEMIPHNKEKEEDPFIQSIKAKKNRFQEWHTDSSWRTSPPSASILQAINVPEFGGNTYWIDCNFAYKKIPRHLKKRILNKKIIHVNEKYNSFNVSHPIIRTHPENKLKSIYINFSLDSKVEGVTRKESDKIINDLYEFIIDDEFKISHMWEIGDIAIWDNRSTLHFAENNYGDFNRLMKRIIVTDYDIPH